MVIAKRKATSTNQDALNLLISEDFPVLTSYAAEKMDFEGKDAWRERKNGIDNIRRAYYCRVVAARNFERLGELEKAAFSYDKAAKNAKPLGFSIPLIVCMIRACKLFNRLYKETKITRYNKEVDIHLKQISEGLDYLDDRGDY